MSLKFAAAVRAALWIVAFPTAAFSIVSVSESSAEASPSDDASNPWCIEGHAMLAARLAYLEVRISPEPAQQDAWQTFANKVRAAAGELDRFCAAQPAHAESAGAAERLEGMEKQAAAMQAMFGAVATAYSAIVPVLTPAQRDFLSRNLIPPAPPLGPFPPPPGGAMPRPGEVMPPLPFPPMGVMPPLAPANITLSCRPG